MSQPLLSLCMIVKNEERYLPEFLKHHQNIFDDWVIVDTGSTDATIDILQKAQIPLRQWEWKDDFAAARNEALRHCRGEWILALDADERIDINALRLFKKNAASLHHDALVLTIKNYLEEISSFIEQHSLLANYCPPDGSYKSILLKENDFGYFTTELIRLFRNNKGFHWVSPIHEVLESPELPSSCIGRNLEMVIHHLGGLSVQPKKTAKENLYREISLEIAKRGYEESSSQILYESARFLEDNEKKLQILSLAHKKSPVDPHILKEISNTYMEQGKIEEAILTCGKMIELLPNQPEGYLALTQCISLKANSKDALNFLKAHYVKLRNFPTFHYTLAILSLQEGLFPEALSYAKRALALAPTSPMIKELSEKLQLTAKIEK